MPKARISVRAGPPSQSEAPKLSARALQLGQLQVPLYSGAVHYFRLKPTAWRPALEALKSLGLNMVETYIPWGVHELRDGSYDFGQYDPQKDLGAFLDLAHSLGLYAFVRPGPNVNAELTYFGLPRRIVFDEACQARSARGRPLPFIAPPRMFPVPSLASERFFDEVERWYTEAGKIVAPRVWPRGPVVLMQVDNEAAYYFRDAPYDQDHHPDALAAYRGFLRQRYSTLDALNEAHAIEHVDWDEVLPPTSCPVDASHGVLRRSLDLMAFQEHLLAGALERMRGALRGSFGPLPTVHNTPMGESGLPVGLARLDQVVDVNGLDYYHRRSDLRTVRERTLRLAGSVRLPYAPEVGVGAPPWFGRRSNADSLHTLLCACAYGVRGLNLYMAVDRDRWYGAPFDELGRERPHAEDLRRVMRALARTQFHTLTRRVEVGIMLPKEYAQLSRATHTLGALSPALLAVAGAGAHAACSNGTFGFDAPIQLAWHAYVEAFVHALDRIGVPYVYIESDAPTAQLESLRVLISPTYELADPERIATMARFAERGGRVLYGPHIPQLDTCLTPIKQPSPLQREDLGELRRCDADQADMLIADLAGELDLAPLFTATPDDVEVTVHEDHTGPRVLFVVQPHAATAQVEISVPEPMTLIDVVTGDQYGGDTTIKLPAMGYACRMFVCNRSDSSSLPYSKQRAPSARARRSLPTC
ncbi:MAG: beta-galactosidase [Polyangiales bacterium]